ncbi:MAG: hypothetical protein P4L50_01770 [Anaerolineaceae bacterium]|nr:hypothetical protein [Alphaproteobacteria bacterium]MDR3572565.1 hypothetical protein [Anaerolineaceae bacterium]
MAVLIKGKSITCSQYSRDHYLRGRENERITLREVLGFATKDPDEALRMIELSAKGTKCKKPLYSVKLNPEPDRIWTKEEIRRAIKILEENLGLKDHPCVVVEHKKHGRIHFHVLWSRYHPDGGPARNMGNDYAIHQKTQRQIEKEFQLRPMMAKGRDFKQWEVEWAKRYGFDIFALRQQITKDFNGVKSGQEFMDAMKAKGCVLCRGDKSQFVLILPWGQHKALSSMIHGRPTKAVLRRAFADIDIAKLPTVPEGKAQVKATLPKIKRKPPQRNAHVKHVKRRSTQAASWRGAGSLITSRRPKSLSSPTMAATLMTEAAARQITQREMFPQGERGEKPAFASRPGYIDVGEIPSGRAEAAYKEEFDKWQGLIDATASDPSLSKDQRLAAVAALSLRQKAAAKAVRKQVRNEEKAIAKAAHRAKRILLGRPESPQQQ